MHRAPTLSTLLVSISTLVLTACPPQQEPVLVGKQAPPAKQAAPEKAEPAAPEPAPPAPDPNETSEDPTVAGAGGSGGTSAAPPSAPPSAASAANGGENEKAAPKPEPKPKPSPANAVNGKDVYSAKCKTCHGPDGKADTKMGHKHDIPDMTAPDWDRKWPLDKIERIVRDGKTGTKMKSFAQKLSDDEIAAVAKFVRSL